MNIRRIISGATLATMAATTLVACGNDDDSETIKIGTTDASQESWSVFEKKAKEEGIKLDIVNYSDYNTPNDALAQGQLDVNKFQHLKFLSEYNEGSGSNLVPVGSTEIYPLDLFWKDHDNIDDIEGESVVIPNDPSNQGRAINVLVQADLVKLKKPGMITPTPADIDEKGSKVSVTPVDAAQTPTAYGEGKPAIINNSWLERAGIQPEDAVFNDDPESKEAEPYINVFATTEEKKDDPQIAKLVELWRSDEVMDAVARDSKDTAVAVDRPNEDLEAILKRLQEAE